MYSKHIWLTGLVIVLLLPMVWPAAAQDEGEIPQIIIEATADGVTIPEEMPEGAVEVTFTNSTEAPINLIVARLNDGVTQEDLMAALGSGGEEAALELVSLSGFLAGEPGSAESTLLILSSGNYVVVIESETGGMGAFTVADGPGEGAAPPEADVEVGLVDFAFVVPVTVEAGAQVWHIENTGEQNHELIVFPLPDDLTVAGFNELLLSDEETDGPPPVAATFVAPGAQTWLQLDLEPGVYALICFFPDTSGSGHPHMALGMRQIITVTEAQ